MTTFENIRSYTDLINANISFLNGEIPRTPYHCGSIDGETLPLVDKLVKINKNGFVTVGGQPGTLDVKFQSKYNSDRIYTYSQKSYIEGYIRKTHLLRLLEFIDDNETISKHGKFVYKVYDLKKNNSFFKCCLDSVRLKLLYNSVPGNNFPLSVQKREDSSGIYCISTACIPYRIDPTFCFLDYPNIIEQLVPFNVYIIISATEFGERSAEDLLIDFYKKIEFEIF